MATTASARATPASRRSPPVGPPTASTPSPSIARGATARSAVSPRVSSSLNGPAGRRGSIKSAVAPTPVTHGEPRETRESLSASLKEETEKKEQLLVQLQDKEQTIAGLTTDNSSLSSALNAAETRLAELYADQSRMEEEMAARFEVIDKLRTQVRDLEKEKREMHRRYNEQRLLTQQKTATFEAERQAFYDNEQHLKSRIQTLTQARKQPSIPLTSPSVVSVAMSESVTEVEEELSQPPQEAPKQDVGDPEQEPAEMTALKLELSTLSTSYTSLHSTLALLQTQLVDLKRVNNELQEENESYNILLREKTLNGQFDILRMGAGAGTSETSVSESSDDGDVEVESRDSESLRSRNTGRSMLDPVDELAEEHEYELDPAFELDGDQEQDSREAEDVSRNPRRHARKHSSHSSRSPPPRGESLANLPITGPGLDLAAELGRAENKDILVGGTSLENERAAHKNRKGRKTSGSETARKVSSASEPVMDSSVPVTDIDALRNEVKSLKDANKALSLYASKIIDRIISQEGFEHVLAVDYDKMSPPPTATNFTTFSNIPKSPSPPAQQPQKKGRPQSAIFPFSSSSAMSNGPASPNPERLTTFGSPTPPSAQRNSSAGPLPPPMSSRASRRSLSFDWKSFSMFGGGDKKPEPSPNLRPLTLRAGSNPVVTGARKLETQEDEEDRKERERLNATMKLMGIEKPVVPVVQKSYSSSSNPASIGLGVLDTNVIKQPNAIAGTANSPAPPTPSRFSFFRRNSLMTVSDTSSMRSSAQGSPHPGASTPNLTEEALEQAEAENTLAALDAHERQLSAEIAKGAGGGYTEIVRRTGDRRSSRKSGESASTVWSAGMSKGEDGDD
ncbi:hypothetical protein IEO21_00007 [Rhodonia placenta]|uniref:Uncharacterized protein n=1 Tax=Rhodonia placenta TaxID=104341 RepID=A0A8H7U6U4_9APHY|nr:hypothetical protein IEO21_00007 [Postia placenta]